MNERMTDIASGLVGRCGLIAGTFVGIIFTTDPNVDQSCGEYARCSMHFLLPCRGGTKQRIEINHILANCQYLCICCVDDDLKWKISELI